MAGAMKAITANPQFSVIMPWKRVNIGGFIQRLVKCRIKHGYGRGIRQQLTKNVNTQRVYRVVKRGQFSKTFDLR